ncbi:MAG: alanine racemase [Coprobacillaceae bacterium]
MSLYRDSYAVINLKNLKYNIETVYNKVKKPFMAIIKADAYGHGYKEVASYLHTMPHIEMFGVATLKEALDLRKLGITKDILVLGAIPLTKEDIELAITHNISLTVFSIKYVTKLESIIPKDKALKIHIKLDTGMNRIGFKSKEEFEEVLQKIKQSSFMVDGVFTHFATADCDEEGYHQQLKGFYHMLGDKKFKYIHCSNSAGMVYHQEDVSNIGRIGIVMYGVEPSGEDTKTYKQVMSLYTKVVQVKKISKGEKVGYGFDFTADKDCYIATLPIGYADGIIRHNKGREVYANGNYYPIVGRVCMDQMMIQVDENIQENDLVEIFGEHLSLARMAKELDTIPYEIMCLISKRVERIYEK